MLSKIILPEVSVIISCFYVEDTILYTLEFLET